MGLSCDVMRVSYVCIQHKPLQPPPGRKEDGMTSQLVVIKMHFCKSCFSSNHSGGNFPITH